MGDLICGDWPTVVQSFLASLGVVLDMFIIQYSVAVFVFFGIGLFIRSIFRRSSQDFGYAEGNLLLWIPIVAGFLYVNGTCG